MRKQRLAYTTNASGAATVKGSAVFGKLYGILYIPGTTDTGATVTVTCEGDASHTLLVKATAGTSNLWFYPRELMHNPSDGAALTGSAGGDRALPVLDGYPQVVIASGGNTLSGAVVVYYE